MKPETKLKLRKWALMTLRSIVWSVDEWLHAQELRLREDLEQLSSLPSVNIPRKPRLQFGSGDGAASVKRAGELRASAPIKFDEWLQEAQERGIEARPKNHRRRGMPARAFDLRFSQR